MNKFISRIIAAYKKKHDITGLEQELNQNVISAELASMDVPGPHGTTVYMFAQEVLSCYAMTNTSLVGSRQAAVAYVEGALEQLAGLRAIPGLVTFRPCDSKEVAAGWYAAMTQKRPVALVLSRQDCALNEKSGPEALKGGYIISDCDKETPDVILLASGSEVECCVGAQALLKDEGIAARVVSMPSFELFDEQSDEYKESVLPKSVRARVAVEAAATLGWHKYVGLDGEVLGIDRFGQSAPYKFLFKEYGFTAENVASLAKKTLNK